MRWPKRPAARPITSSTTCGRPGRRRRHHRHSQRRHREPAVAAARAGKHVIVEKPLEITLRRCDQIIEACRQAGVVLSTIFPSRFHDSSRELKRAVESGRFGRLTLGDAYVKWYRSQTYYDSGGWRGTWELDGGGALMNQAIHSVDLLTWLMGPVVEVRAKRHFGARADRGRGHRLGHGRVRQRGPGGDRGQHGRLSRLFEADRDPRQRRLGRDEEEDLVKWDFEKRKPRDEAILTAMANRKSGGGGAADPAAIGHHAHAKQFQNVVQAIRGARPGRRRAQGRRSVEIILAITIRPKLARPSSCRWPATRR